MLIISGIISVVFMPKILLNINRFHATSFFVMFIPIYGVLVYLLRGGQFQNFSDTSYISSAVVIASTIAFTNMHREALIRYIYIISVVFSSILFLAAFELLLSDTRNTIDYIFTYDIGRVAFRNYGGIEVPFVYLFASPLLLLPIGLLLSRLQNNTIKNYESVLLFFFTLALCLSGTRSHVFISICVVLLYIYRLRNAIYKFLFFLLSFLLIVLPSISVFQHMLSMENESNAFKFSMLNVYYNIYSNPLSFLFGQGFNAHVWDFRLRDILQGDASKSELTYLEFLRVFGIFSFLYFLCVVISAFVRNNIFRISFLLLSVDSLLNPHMFSTYGAIITGLYLNKYQGE